MARDDPRAAAPADGDKRAISTSKRLMAINSASSVLSRIVNVTVLVWIYQYLLARMPTEEFAIYPVVTALMLFAPLFFVVFTTGVSRHLIDALARGEPDGAVRVISSIFPLLAGTAALFLAVGLAFALSIDRFFQVPPGMVEDARLMLVLLVVSFTVQMLCQPFTLGYHVRQRFVELNVLTLVRECLRAGLLFALLYTLGPEVLWVVVATVAAETAFVIVVVIRSRRMVPELVVDLRHFEMAKARSLLSFGVWTTLGQLGSILYTNAATLVLNLYGSALDVTVYFIGATLYRQLQMLIITAVQPLQPAMTAMHSYDDRETLTRTVFSGGRYALWVTTAAALPLIVFAPDFVWLYLGDGFGDASDIIVLFMLTFPFTQATALLPAASIAAARVREFFLPAFLFQLLGFVLMVFFAREAGLGAVGITAALAGVAVASQLLYFWPFCMRLTGAPTMRFVREVLWAGMVPGLMGLAGWIAMALALDTDSWAKLVLHGVPGGVLFLAGVWIAMNGPERAGARRALAKLTGTKPA
ncbi:MAG: oligosaccharide flippase family protein [Pseudomonadota bacterium]